MGGWVSHRDRGGRYREGTEGATRHPDRRPRIAEEALDMHDPAQGPTDPGDMARPEPDQPAPRSRRSLLAAAAAAVGAVAAQSVASVAPVAAATGDAVKAGKTTSASATTTVRNTASGYGVRGVGRIGARGEGTTQGVSGTASASGGLGVHGQAPSGFGVRGDGESIGVYGVASAPSGTGVQGTASGSSAAWGVGGITTTGHGVHGESTTGHGVHGSASVLGGVGVYGTGTAYGVQAVGRDADAIGISTEGRIGIVVDATEIGVNTFGPIALNAETRGGGTKAARFVGDVSVLGLLSKSGGSFLIDHPLDPANRYLAHSFVESPDMKNIYDGVVTLDRHGRATVRLQKWFEALNMEYRYQLTAIGAAAPELHIAREIDGGRFVIAGGAAGLRVSWQVTGIRKDAWANKHRIKVDTAKRSKDRGRFLNPGVHGAARSQAIGYRKPPKPSKRARDEAREVTRAPLPVPVD
jgi:hypothetical protein